MSSKAIYLKDKIIPAIIKLLRKECFFITQDHIKIWSCDSMNMSDVVIGCNYVKSKLSSYVICYTNKVNNIEYLEKNEGVTIFDSTKLKSLALKHGDLELYDMLS